MLLNSPFGKMDAKIRSHVRSLQVKRLVDHNETLRLYDDLLQHVRSEQELLEVSSYVPFSFFLWISHFSPLPRI